MHKCQNKSAGNVSHLEQMVDRFFPYSQKQLGFDQPVIITFQSDDENASKMLGKTAYYDPGALEVVLYTDNRHPKDVMRSLSHELVHHAQNCRGDFGAQNDTGAGYAQEDPHLRKMEREAYTKGNLIFRDFEDLIKTGKINIEIDFSDSGEPKMSLKEWKNNEINTKLMKKWGFLNEGKPEEDESANQRGNQKVSMEDEMGLEEEMDESYIDLAQSRGQLHKTIEDEEGDDPDLARAHGVGEPEGEPEPWRRGRVTMRAITGPDDPRLKTNPTPEYSGTRAKARTGSRSAGHLRGAPRQESKKISVREAKEITRRIIERIKKESK